MIYGYARVSTLKQLHGNSVEDQMNLLKAEGCEQIITEQYTGTTTDRPQFVALLGKLQAGDKLVVTKLDRLARNVIEGIEAIRALFAKGVKVHVLNVGLLENSMMGHFFLTILLAVAALERDTIIERTQAGKEIARTKKGYTEGRPHKYTPLQMEYAMELLNDHSFNQVARITGISKSTLIRNKHRILPTSI
jgi:DNA invertase Pin-like site-specific DNA recombinase